MKQVLRNCCIGLCCCFLAMSAMAATFYQNPEGEIIMELSTPEDAGRLLALFGERAPVLLTEGEDGKTITPQTFSEQDFNVAQAKLIAFVRDINWKTGFNLTMRDVNFWQRLKMVFTGITVATQPMRVNLNTIYPGLEDELGNLEDQLVDALQNYAEASTFDRAVALSLLGLRFAILDDKPFLLLFIDEGQYKELIALDKRLEPEKDSAIEKLMNNIYTFFSYRSIYMDKGYDANTEKLIDVAKLGEGDAESTWEKMAEFATNMYNLDKTNDLTPETEANLRIPRLEFAMRRVKHNIKVEKKAAKIAYKDPNNADLVAEAKSEGPQNPNLEQEARELLKTLTRNQIKMLMLKYCIK